MKLIIRFVYGSSYNVAVDHTHLITEGHTLIAMMPWGNLQFGACDCEECARQDEVQRADPNSFLGWLIEDVRPAEVLLVLHPDMTLPVGEEGLATGAVKFVSQIAKALLDEGVLAEITDSFGEALEPGSWVRFSRDYLVNQTYCLEAGMLGQVMPDPYRICTPGVSALVRPVGFDFEYGFFCELFEPISEPDDTAIKEAQEQAKQSYVGFQERNGWHGILGPNLPIDRATRELLAFTRNLPQETNEKAVRGGLKRVAKLLDKFAISPWADDAATLSVQCRNDLDAKAVSPELMDALRAFLERVEEAEKV
ncbi:hypothetical protein FRD01_14520 [Microvenator marinus]|uniref:Uncharacterized protein n=1 Tax=Microvenator marinus TaxID=2600177 RepID=A0A5B8XXL7_9DELT|nr:hypothetical protein [Microvenator marinus]QED28426.1 hypothetical protein FRD01_14520 [Microvenator marinus]